MLQFLEARCKCIVEDEEMTLKKHNVNGLSRLCRHSFRVSEWKRFDRYGALSAPKRLEASISAIYLLKLPEKPILGLCNIFPILHGNRRYFGFVLWR